MEREREREGEEFTRRDGGIRAQFSARKVTEVECWAKPCELQERRGIFGDLEYSLELGIVHPRLMNRSGRILRGTCISFYQFIFLLLFLLLKGVRYLIEFIEICFNWTILLVWNDFWQVEMY